MNKKQFIILIGLVAVFGIWGITRWRGQTSSFNGGSDLVGQKLLGEFDVNAVSQLVIKQGTNELVLAKKDEVWRVTQRDNYPANFTEISSMLVKLKNLKVVQTEQVGLSQLSRLELVASGTNAPTVVEFIDAGGKAFKTLTLGKKHMRSGQSSPMDEFGGDGGYPDGRYVQVSGSVDSVAVISDPLSDVTPNAAHWVNKNFFKIEKPKTISVTFAEATNSWTLSRETENGEWKLADAKAEEILDLGKSASVTGPFSSPSLNDVEIGLSAEQSGLEKPTVIKVATFDGFYYTVGVGAKRENDYVMTVAVTANLVKERAAAPDEKPEDKAKADKEFTDNLKRLEEKLATESSFNKWTYRIAAWGVDPLLKKRTELLEEKTPASAEGSTPPLESAPGN